MCRKLTVRKLVVIIAVVGQADIVFGHALRVNKTEELVVSHIVLLKNKLCAVVGEVVQYGKHKMRDIHFLLVLSSCFEHCKSQYVVGTLVKRDAFGAWHRTYIIHPQLVVKGVLYCQRVTVQFLQSLVNCCVTLAQNTEEKRLGSNGVVGESGRFFSTER